MGNPYFFSESFLYVLILINLFIDVKKLANFLVNILKKKGENMTQQHQKWIQLVKDKLNSEGMTQTHLARACGVKKPTISELLKYGKGSNRLKNRVCDVLGIDETWVDLGE
nr:MAG: helix-turn-helix domain protein [Bacteriophage sp.]